MSFEQENWFVFGVFRQGLDGWQLRPEPGTLPSQINAYRVAEGLLVEQSMPREIRGAKIKREAPPEPGPASVLCQALTGVPADRQAVMRARLRLMEGNARLWVRFWTDRGAEILGGHQWAAPSTQASTEWQTIEFDFVVPTEAVEAAAGIIFGGKVKAAVAECEFRLIEDSIEAYLIRLLRKIVQNCDGLPTVCWDAFQKAPRHIFLPDIPPAVAYTDDAIVTRYDEQDGQRVAVSSSSQPSMMALMLRDLDPSRGQRVLEIGTGTGYNAALLAAIVGEDNVVSIDIDQAIVDTAAANLDRAGVTGVELHAVDGWGGWPGRAPYDRIIITVGVPDIAPAWFDQLSEGGVIVMPLSVQCLEFSIAFRKEGDKLKSTSILECKFMDLRGERARNTYSRTESGWLIKQTSLTSDEVDTVVEIMARPSTELTLSSAEPPRLDGFVAYLTLRHTPTVGLSGPALAAFRIVDGAGAYAIVDLVDKSAAIPQATFGSTAIGEKLRDYYADWCKIGQPGAERLHLTAYPRDLHPTRPKLRASASRGVVEYPSTWLMWEYI